jgi:hypothetical protein
MAKIELLQALSIPGSPDRENDDAMGSTASIAFVLDGVTSLAEPPLMSGRSDAAWVAHLARDLLLKSPPAAAADLPGLMKSVATEITAQFEGKRARPPAGRYELPWTTMSLIAVEARLARKMIAAGKGMGVDAQRQTILEELRSARNIVNTPEGYWLLGADPAVSQHLGMTSLTIDGPVIALLATDGFYALVEDYHRYGDRELIATAQTVGLQALARELRHIEHDDADGKTYPRMKKSDDATAILLRIEP